MNDARARVERAQAHAVDAGKDLGALWRPWQVRMHDHRTALLAGVGVATGLAAATLPPKFWSRVGAVLFGSGARLARSSLLPVVVAAIWKSRPPSRPRQS